MIKNEKKKKKKKRERKRGGTKALSDNVYYRIGWETWIK